MLISFNLYVWTLLNFDHTIQPQHLLWLRRKILWTIYITIEVPHMRPSTIVEILLTKVDMIWKFHMKTLIKTLQDMSYVLEHVHIALILFLGAFIPSILPTLG